MISWRRRAAHLSSIPDHKATPGTTTQHETTVYRCYVTFFLLKHCLYVVNVTFYLYIGDEGWDIGWERGSALMRPVGELAASSVPGKSSPPPRLNRNGDLALTTR